MPTLAKQPLVTLDLGGEFGLTASKYQTHVRIFFSRFEVVKRELVESKKGNNVLGN
jgi:hypothetical protein